MNQAASADALTLAESTARAMFSRDSAAHALGIQITEVAPGQATLTMTVRQDMLNGHRICHGGMIFLLADTTFAYACNSYNHNTVASACHIDFLVPAHEGDVLEAHAVEQTLSGKTGVYDITVRLATTREAVALFRGKSHRIKGTVIESLHDAGDAAQK